MCSDHVRCNVDICMHPNNNNAPCYLDSKDPLLRIVACHNCCCDMSDIVSCRRFYAQSWAARHLPWNIGSTRGDCNTSGKSADSAAQAPDTQGMSCRLVRILPQLVSRRRTARTKLRIASNGTHRTPGGSSFACNTRTKGDSGPSQLLCREMAWSPWPLLPLSRRTPRSISAFGCNVLRSAFQRVAAMFQHSAFERSVPPHADAARPLAKACGPKRLPSSGRLCTAPTASRSRERLPQNAEFPTACRSAACIPAWLRPCARASSCRLSAGLAHRIGASEREGSDPPLRPGA
jgi:hypothetical protein